MSEVCGSLRIEKLKSHQQFWSSPSVSLPVCRVRTGTRLFSSCRPQTPGGWRRSRVAGRSCGSASACCSRLLLWLCWRDCWCGTSTVSSFQQPLFKRQDDGVATLVWSQTSDWHSSWFQLMCGDVYLCSNELMTVTLRRPDFSFKKKMFRGLKESCVFKMFPEGKEVKFLPYTTGS